MSLMFLSMIFLLCVLSRASVTRIQEVLAETPSIQDILGPSPELADGSIEFIDASFSYGGPGDNLTLENISLSIRSGEMIGIIGGTGSAKSTLVQLIPRLYDLSGSKRPKAARAPDRLQSPDCRQTTLPLQCSPKSSAAG